MKVRKIPTSRWESLNPPHIASYSSDTLTTESQEALRRAGLKNQLYTSDKSCELLNLLTLVVEMLNRAIHRINDYLADKY